jgi:methyl-accepting chemotaxis protein
MKWFYNLKVSAKLLLGFCFVAMLTAFIGYLGITNMKTIDDNDTLLYEQNTVPIAKIGNVQQYFHRVRVRVRDAVFATDRNEINEHVQKIEEYSSIISADVEYCSKLIDNEDEERLYAEFNEARSVFRKDLSHIILLIKENKDSEAISFMHGEMLKSAMAEQDAIGKWVEFNIAAAKQRSDDNSMIADSATNTLIFIIVLSVIIAIGFGIFISKIISKPLIQLTSIADKVAAGEVDVEVHQTTKDEVGMLMGAFNSLIENVKTQVSAAERIADGDLNVEVKVKSEKDALNKAFVKVVKSLKDLVSEATMLSKAGVEGRLSTRGNAGNFKGGYKDIVQGVNETLDAVIKPTQEGAGVLEIMAQGDFTPRVSGNYLGDHQLLKNSINKMGESVGAILNQVKEAVQATASASTEISSSTEQMAAGAQEQSSQASEVAAAVEEMSKTILETTKNSSSASEASKKAGQIAKEGGAVVNQTIAGINRIADVVKESAATVQQLGKSSDQIGEIVQVIDDIADQTNLLALNAAIEAARAGEQGRGFAVVADEVRKLAERTTKATKEIAVMIKQIQKDTSGAVESMNQGTVEVEKGKELANKAGDSLKQIITGAESVVDLITQVAAASEEQSAASEQISKNIEGISSVTQESAAGVQQIARAAEDLNRLTSGLEALVAKFKINETSNGLSVKQNGKLVHNN